MWRWRGRTEGDNECGYWCRVRIREARASASDAMRWSRSESSKGVEDHGGGDSGGYSSSGKLDLHNMAV
jgi:hypothetical protein